MIILPVTYINTNTNNVQTEIITNVNGQETKIESNESGTIKVENINGEVKIESDTDYEVMTNNSSSSSPVIKTFTIASASPILNSQNQLTFTQNIFTFFANLFNKISDLFVRT